MSAGRLTTCRHSPVSTMTLRTTLVNRPKKPFQSPGTHQRGAAISAVFITSSSTSGCLECGHDGLGRGDPAEDAALRLDHAQPHLLKLREVRADAIGHDEAVVAAVVSLAHRRIYANLGGDPANDQLGDAAVLQHRVEVGGVKRTLARLIDYRLARQRVEFGDDVVPGLAAHQDAAHRARVADAGGQPAASFLRRRQVGEVGTMTLARVDDGQPRGARPLEQGSDWRDGARNSDTSLPSAAPNPPGSRKSRCISMMTKLARARSSSNA